MLEQVNSLGLSRSEFVNLSIAIISAIATIISVVVAGRALNSWKIERKYDLLNRAASLSRPAINIVSSLRKPIYVDFHDTEIELLDYEQCVIHHKRFGEIFNHRLNEASQLISKVKDIQEELWANLGEEDHYYLFYLAVNSVIKKTIRDFKIIQSLANPDFSDPKENEAQIIKLTNETFPNNSDVLMDAIKEKHEFMLARHRRLRK